MRHTTKGTRFFLWILVFTLLSGIATLRADTGMQCHANVSIDQHLPAIPRPPVPNHYFSQEESSFLIFPEWYIVFSADEYGAFLKTQPPSQFPYFAAIKQFWQSYACVTSYTKDKYAFNSNNHLVSVVIGVSYSLEYGIKGSYENTLGRVNELLSGNVPVQEELFAQQVAQEYGTFLHTQAWFLFPFWEKLGQLWQETDLLGPHLLRKWERKIILSGEYLLKGVYAAGLKKATYSTIGEPDLTTELWTSTLPAALATGSAQIQIIDPADDTSDFIQVPRYEAFKKTIPVLFASGVQIYEVGGNHSILTTVLAPQNWQSNEYPMLFEMDLVSDPNLKRVAIPVAVTQLDAFLEMLQTENIQLEHIYDY